MKTPRCQICGKPQDEAYRPFCSPRCANVDLQRWLTGRYAIAARDDDEADSAGLGEDDEG
jgi:endogenous inhibitor of DNA gyrase (YacG/DUF329 family)